MKVSEFITNKTIFKALKSTYKLTIKSHVITIYTLSKREICTLSKTEASNWLTRLSVVEDIINAKLFYK